MGYEQAQRMVPAAQVGILAAGQDTAAVGSPEVGIGTPEGWREDIVVPARAGVGMQVAARTRRVVENMRVLG